jgi:hypothetical protein
MCNSRESFLKIGSLFGRFAPPPFPCRDPGVLKFTINVCLAPKILHTKSEKNWNGSYQKEIKK